MTSITCLVSRARPPEPIRPVRPITNLPWTLRNPPRQARPCLSFQPRLQRSAATAIENSIASSPRPRLLLKDAQARPIQLLSKEDTASNLQQWLATLSAHSIIIFSDGSQQNRVVGWGYTIFSGNTLKSSGHGRLGQAEDEASSAKVLERKRHAEGSGEREEEAMGRFWKR